MPTDDAASLPRHLGDYPDGAYWSADRPAGSEDAEPTHHKVSGRVIRLMWDYGVRVPLWDAEGLLPEEPEWLKGELRLSDGLIGDLTRWGHDMNDLDADPGRRTASAYQAMDARARDLAARLQREVGDRYTVDYVPW